MEYAILIHSEASNEPEAWNDAERAQAFFAEMNAFASALEASGEFVTARRLSSPDKSTTVRREGDRTVTTDGPFAETKECLAGFFLVECEGPDRALEIARSIPATRLGPIEVRPIGGRKGSG